MMGVNTRDMYSCLQKYNKLNKSHLVGQLLNLIHDARTHEYKIKSKEFREGRETFIYFSVAEVIMFCMS